MMKEPSSGFFRLKLQWTSARAHALRCPLIIYKRRENKTLFMWTHWWRTLAQDLVELLDWIPKVFKWSFITQPHDIYNHHKPLHLVSTMNDRTCPKYSCFFTLNTWIYLISVCVHDRMNPIRSNLVRLIFREKTQRFMWAEVVSVSTAATHFTAGSLRCVRVWSHRRDGTGTLDPGPRHRARGGEVGWGYQRGRAPPGCRRTCPLTSASPRHKIWQ